MAKSNKKKSQTKENSQWIFLMKDECLVSGPDNENVPQFFKLRHPKTDEAGMYLFCREDKDVYEVNKFNENFRSWFINETVQEDGALHITTKVDPTYLVLPYLIQTEKSDKYQIIDQIISDEDFPECARLCNCIENEALENIADVKGSGDIKAYRYNKDKTLMWLKRKVEQVADKLKTSEVNVSGGAISHVFVKSHKTEQSSTEDYERFAHGMLSEYIPASLSQQLKEFMGIKEAEPPVHEKPDISEPPSKKAKKGGKVEPLEDYSQQNIAEDTKNNKPLNAAQNKLKKVDTKGMKSISSFFSPKGKK